MNSQYFSSVESLFVDYFEVYPKITQIGVVL